MLSHSKQEAQQVKAELSDMTQSLALEGGQQEMQYMSVLKVSRMPHMSCTWTCCCNLDTTAVRICNNCLSFMKARSICDQGQFER